MTELFASTFIALFVGHSVGDHWIQTAHQVQHKHLRNRQGIRACSAHVATLTLTKIIFLGLVYTAKGAWPHPGWLILGLGADTFSHYWADRRYTLERLARTVGKLDFYQFGGDTRHETAPPGSHVGTGKYVLDQSFHHFFLFLGAVLISL